MIAAAVKVPMQAWKATRLRLAVFCQIVSNTLMEVCIQFYLPQRPVVWIRRIYTRDGIEIQGTMSLNQVSLVRLGEKPGGIVAV